MITGSMKGGPELLRFLQSLPDTMQRKVMRGAMRAGAKVIADEARLKAPVREGDLRRSIKFSARLRGSFVVAKVNTRGPGAYKAPWIEFGTQPHLISARGRQGEDRAAIVRVNRAARRKGGLRIGGQFAGPAVMHPGTPPRPFFRPALDGRADEAVQAVAGYIRARLTKEGLRAPDEVDDE